MTRLKRSLNHAIEGILEAFKNEPNFKIQVIIAAAVILAGIIADLNTWKWAVLFITIALVLSLELINTACEKMINVLVKDHHPSIKYVKDILAASVLIVSVMAFLIAVIIFIL